MVTVDTGHMVAYQASVQMNIRKTAGGVIAGCRLRSALPAVVAWRAASAGFSGEPERRVCSTAGHALDTRTVSDEAYYTISSGGFVPADFACGPWSMDMAHGRLLGGLAARAIEAELGDAGWRGARLTMDLFRAASMEAVRVSTEVIRSGGRIRVADATVVVGGHEVARARAVFLKAGDEPPGTIWQPERASWPDPETLDPPPRSDGGEPDTRWRIRDAGGAFQGAERAKLWTEETVPLVAGEALSPFVRAAVSSDLASPLANSGDDGVHYINGDYTMVLARYPVGTWIGMHAAQHLAADGIALGECTMYDFDGAFGTSVATALSRPPLRPPLSPPVSSALSE